MKKVVVAGLLGVMICALSACNGSNTNTVSVTPDAPVDEVVSQVSTEVEETVKEVDSTVVEAVKEEINDNADVETPDFAGTWIENIAGRGVIEITSTGEDTYSINVHWGSSAFESSNWEMTGTYYISTGLLEYSDAKYYIRTYEDEENYTDDVKYEDGSGYFWMEGYLLNWSSDKKDIDGIDGSSLFELMQ